MNSDIVISVLLTAYNCEKFLEDTLESLKQACSGVQELIEIILVNDGSTDKTNSILQRFSETNPRAKIFDVSFHNIGQVRNYGVNQCNGQYITMLDGDDQLIQGSFIDIVNCLQNYQPDLLLAPLNEVYSHKMQPLSWNGLKTKRLTQHQTIEKFLIHRELQAHFIGQFIKRDLLANNYFPEFICYEDAWLFPCILKASKNIIFASQSPYLYFKRGHSLSNSLDIEKISLLIKATKNMDEVLGEEYRNLLTCHWINIAHKFGAILNLEQKHDIVFPAIEKASFLSLMFDSKVRASFKKKYVQFKIKGHH